MSTKLSKTMIAAYMQTAAPTLFLQGMFQAPAQNFYQTETVEIDIQRDDEDVAVAITDISTGHRMNSDDLYTNKEFKPPVYREGSSLNAFDLFNREPGDNPFESTSFQAKASARAIRSMAKLEKKLQRAIELQASQVLQTGELTLTDAAGKAVYTLDFAPKAAHFPTAGTTWGAGGDDIYGDLEALAEVIRTNGKCEVDQLILGDAAYDKFISDTKIQGLLDNRRMNVGGIVSSQPVGNGGIFRGTIDIGNYKFEIWTYSGRYKHAQTGASTKFVAPGSVIMRDSAGRMDATFGAIPRLVEPERRALRYLPNRIPNSAGRISLDLNAWVTPDGSNIVFTLGTRPLMIPTAIDSFGCLDTGL